MDRVGQRVPGSRRLGVILGIFALISSTGCSPGYVLRGAYEQGKILIARRDIDKVIEDPETPQEQRAKLQLVLDARAYAQGMGLDPGGSFTSFAEVSRDPLAWVVVASRRDAFALYTWWFPIVGTVPYKGFFEKEDAEAQVKELGAEGWETSMRGTEAFSTLGWFNDPVVSTTLKSAATRIANTVIHESVHSTVWIPGSVAFNETLANFIGSQGAVTLFAARFVTCREAGHACELETQQLHAAQKELAFQFEIGVLIDSLYDTLDALYKDPSRSSEDKIVQRVGIFNALMSPFRQKFPTVTILKEVNNADIIQMKLYLSKISLFRELLAKQQGDWGAFIASIRKIQQAIKADPSKDPFAVLQDIVGTAT